MSCEATTSKTGSKSDQKSRKEKSIDIGSFQECVFMFIELECAAQDWSIAEYIPYQHPTKDEAGKNGAFPGHFGTFEGDEIME